MERLVSILSNNGKVIFDTGRFDNWCVYVVEPDGNKYAPRDQHYFSDLSNLAKKHSPQKVYTDFLSFYERTGKIVEPEVLLLIRAIAATYSQEDRAIIEQWFTVIYAGMIAEENKTNAILKKRIKRLGMYQVLIEGKSATEAAAFSLGRKWQDLDLLMRYYGF